jgi:MYXO-CTERM domain-containing protein
MQFEIGDVDVSGFDGGFGVLLPQLAPIRLTIPSITPRPVTRALPPPAAPMPVAPEPMAPVMMPAPEPVAPMVPTEKKSRLPLIIGGVAVLGVAGFFVLRRRRRAQMSALADIYSQYGFSGTRRRKRRKGRRSLGSNGSVCVKQDREGTCYCWAVPPRGNIVCAR